MLSLLVKVGAAALAAGFAGGFITSVKAGSAKDKIKERFSKVETHVIEVQIPKGRSLAECQINVLVPVNAPV